MVLAELGGLELTVSGRSLVDAWPLNWKPSPLLKKRFRVACIILVDVAYFWHCACVSVAIKAGYISRIQEFFDSVLLLDECTRILSSLSFQGHAYINRSNSQSFKHWSKKVVFVAEFVLIGWSCCIILSCSFLYYFVCVVDGCKRRRQSHHQRNLCLYWWPLSLGGMQVITGVCHPLLLFRKMVWLAT